ncbi:MAG TPA: amidohydrolase family protein [Gemmataceae bacterium]|nr:amidohydrolase family protein [Gemmataceae bacterium]
MIDVHIHAVPPNIPGCGPLAPLLTQRPEIIATELRAQMQTTGVTHALAMGAWKAGEDDPLGVNLTLRIAEQVPGLRAIGAMDPTRTDDEHFKRVEAVLATGRVVALKGYLGYLHYEPAHANYRRYYELAAKYHVPVMYHTGDTYSPLAKLRFAHPLGVDEVAVDHPDVRFVICHVGNPWVTDAAEVIYKNMNVWADLSGLIVGDDTAFAGEDAAETKAELIHEIRRVIHYSERPNRFLYGTDWPLAPMPAYRDFIREAVPEEYHECVFEENARRLFRLG